MEGIEIRLAMTARDMAARIKEAEENGIIEKLK